MLKKKTKKCKHKFKPRYDIIYNEEAQNIINKFLDRIESAGFFALKKIIDEINQPNEIYVKDICIKCGKEIKR